MSPLPPPSRLPWIFVWAVVVLFSACTIPSDAFDELPCPCGEGWFCSSRRVCVPNEDDSDPPAVDSTCWQEALGCSWSEAGSFVFEEDDGTRVSLSPNDANLTFSPDACTILSNRSGPDPFDTTGSIFSRPRAPGLVDRSAKPPASRRSAAPVLAKAKPRCLRAGSNSTTSRPKS